MFFRIDIASMFATAEVMHGPLIIIAFFVASCIVTYLLKE